MFYFFQTNIMPLHTENLFLFWCAHEHIDFRIPEFESIAKLFDIPIIWVTEHDEPEKYYKSDTISDTHQSDWRNSLQDSSLVTNSRNGKNQPVVPWVILKLRSEDDALKILSRSISTKYCIHLWAPASSRSELHTNVQLFIKSNKEYLQTAYFNHNKTFKINVDAFMKKLHSNEKHERIESFSYIPFEGSVSLDKPDVTLALLEFFGLDHNNLPLEPFNLFFGRFVGEGQRDLIAKFSLKKRCFIGNTSMDPQLSFLMTNLACIEKGKIMLDPFCGTGSLMLTAAWFGAYVMGTDIDYLTLHARTRPSRVNSGKKRASEESLSQNFIQVGGKSMKNQFLGVVVADVSNPPYQNNLGHLFDAIVTDPPYGIREPAERVGTKRHENVERPDDWKVPEEYLPFHIPQKIDYELGNIYTDLLEFASRHLALGGRLVFWIPVNREHYASCQESSLPKHHNFKLVANCEQVLSSHTSRRCVTMQKFQEDKGSSENHTHQISVPSCDKDQVTNNFQTVKGTTEKFKQNFFKAQELSRQERKDRIKRFGHLNIEQTQIDN